MRRLMLVLLLVLVSNMPLPAQINAGREPELVGVYRCEGTNADGKSYTGTVEIIKHDRRFQVRWTFQNPDGSTAELGGIGIVVDGKFSVAYFAGYPAIVVYTIKKSTPLTLVGEWAVPNTEGVFPEVLTKMPAGHQVPITPIKKPPDRKGEIKG